MALGEASVFRGRMQARPVIVIVRRDCALHHEGRTYGEGELLRLTVDEARQLEEQGVVLRPD